MRRIKNEDFGLKYIPNYIYVINQNTLYSIQCLIYTVN